MTPNSSKVTVMHTQEELERTWHEQEHTTTFWREKVKRTDDSYPTLYYIYLHGNGANIGSITDGKAPQTLCEAENMLAALIESPDTEWTYGIIYEVKPMVRRGTTYNRKKRAR